MSDDELLLRVEGLEKEYTTTEGVLDRLLGNGTRVTAVDGVDLEIYEGETLGLVGESGCGKTSLARSILRLTEPTAGSAVYRDTDLTTLEGSALRELRADVQYVFQNPFESLNPRLTVGDIVGEALSVHDVVPPDERDRRVGELLETVGLRASHATRYPHEFSGGQRQRIGIARALAVEPEFVVLDEPVSALDVSVQAGILNLLEELQTEFGLSYLFIGHDLSVVEHVADRIAVMYLGEIVDRGPTEELFDGDAHPYTEALLSAIPEPDPLWEGDRIVLEGSVPSPADPPSGCRFHTRCPKLLSPAEYDLEPTTVRALLELRTGLAEADGLESLPVDPDPDPEADDVQAALRDAFDVPADLGDDAAEAVLETALETAAAGDVETARARLESAFTTPCETDRPRLEPVDSGAGGPDTHAVACHRFDDAGTETDERPDRAETTPTQQ
ncbi:ABC transporter ATP-binding protein [Natronolimnohabitans sp. A-GB9]|uniref:ABC transporter ATP-binding protein n=1 Tax=Natronolimnohabitans sp. A-GB9 TaxID=3069757 RepID=UPI0027B590F5|nr:ABC transporter ATP-binding protein [Natronolimnohabitans sp. A-GB9]MDQ2049857.1 ABC transporter ATP-binding protein [Natronolimnohabitans sp. A-GB9]